MAIKINSKNKKILLVLITLSLLLTGCGNAEKVSTATVSDASAKSSAAKKSSPTTVTNDSVDYNQYVKKVWKLKNNSDMSFVISKIENSKAIGKLSVLNYTTADKNLQSFEADFEGEINKDTAVCQYNDSKGNKGSLKLVFKSNQEIEGTITIADKAKATVQPSLGTFYFAPETIKDIKGFSPIEKQSFMVNLNSWGNIKFVSGKLTGGSHVPVEFYLTDKDGDILYDFAATLPYRVDVKAVSFEDVNKDGLKDIIIIVNDEDDSSNCLATVYFQKADGSFANDMKLDQEINESKNNKDVKTVRTFLASKF
ncbi:hypothetical protein DEAC_c35000 [Desulfosporosinus acididurans]|uniref:Lipoprotein n=1 Tax=Desulfosporosinus acididurans TaxID=476652 RepID=A0A0J1FM45_9FIRM|nr:hypothetical protein [Desulfosporosinus acididurans]KLU64554.1 hypothetical protein DEAC_c35000 [Desulfosporosinus acididurans]